jgi:hypothetical protein
MPSTSLFLDERISWQETSDPSSFYFLGGISLLADNVSLVASWVRDFKRDLRPHLDPNEWYLKGSGKWLKKGESQEFSETRDEAFARWELWSENIAKLRIPYTINAVLVLPSKVFGGRDNRLTERAAQLGAVLNGSMFAILLSLLPLQPTDLEIWIDHVEGPQYDALRWGTEAVQQVAILHDLPLNIIAVEEVTKTDMSSDESQVLQLVDMHIYALSRFILPSGDESFILADFERLPYAYTSGQLEEFLAGAGASDPDTLSRRYYKIGALYHHLRHRIKKNIAVSKRSLVSTMLLMGRDIHHNFGRDVDFAIWMFCNPMWEQGWSKDRLLIDLSQYE